MTLGNYIINFIAIGLAVVLWMILLLIAKKGQVMVIEPRKWILYPEIVLMVAIVGLAIYNITEFIQ